MTTRRPIALVTSFILALSLVPAASAAQGRGSSGSGAPPMRALTPFEEFVDRLRLDDRTQLPEVQKMLTDGAQGASPIVVEMAQLRQQLINLDIADKAADKPGVLGAFDTAAAKMTDAEAATFTQVFALLKPNQLSRAPAAFEIMAGFFVPPVSPGRAGRGATGVVLGRLDILATVFTLTVDQKKDIKTWFD
jgi:hypothetical protein